MLAPTRWQLRAWLEQACIGADDGLAIQSAADEAISNVIAHAYHERLPGPLRVLANLDAGPAVRIEVADGGNWRPERDPDDTYSGGRGLHVVRRMMDDVAITTGDTGTKIVMRRRLRPSGSD